MLIKNAVVYGKDFEPERDNIRVIGEKIDSVGDMCAEAGEEELDFAGCIAVPGFIDIHIHGRMGCDTCDAKEESLEKISESLASLGITSFCPTTMTLGNEELKKIFACTAGYMGNEKGAYIHGINMEGPYISPAKKGAQNGKYVRNPDFDEFKALSDICPVSLVDVAPETEGAAEFAHKAKDIATVSEAHTSAGYEDAKKGFEKGFTHATHLFNAMTALGSREPGVVGAVFDSDTATAELICDGFHISPVTLRIAFKVLGENRSVVVSDSMMAAGLEDGDYELGGQEVFVRDGKALLADGTIAASTSNILDEFRNVVSFGIPFKQAVKSCTINPARTIGADKYTGTIEEGKFADILILDKELNVKAVFVKGKRMV